MTRIDFHKSSKIFVKDEITMPQLANRFATTEKSIKQSFSLGRLHETTRQVHRDQVVSLNVIKELIKQPDPEIQLEVFNALKKNNYNISRYIIESRLGKASIPL